MTDQDGIVHCPARKDLRHRKFHHVVFGHVSDDKSHDTYAMQHFNNNEIEELEKYMLENCPEDIPGGQIQWLHTKSDNAASHFKSRKSLNYFSRLINKRGGPGKCAYVYSFGAPHHDKGKWDGAGGCMKHKVDQDTASAMTMGSLAHTTSGYIETIRDVYNSLVFHFQEGTHRDRRQTRNGFNAWRFLLYTYDSNPVPRPEENVTALNNISSNYQFVVRNEGTLYIRRRVYYCLQCIASMQVGFAEWNGNTHTIQECRMVSLGNSNLNADDSNPSENVYSFSRTHCERTSGPNVTRQIQEDKRSRNEQAITLTIGDWVLFDSRAEGEPIWLGRVLSNPAWEGMGCLHNTTRRVQTHDNGVVIGANEVALFIQWYEKIDLNGRELHYRVSRSITEPQVQSNYYLVQTNFGMTEINSRVNIVPRLRSTATRNRSAWHTKEMRCVCGKWTVQLGIMHCLNMVSISR